VVSLVTLSVSVFSANRRFTRRLYCEQN